MTNDLATQIADYVQDKTFVTFDELGRKFDCTRDEVIAAKPRIEEILRAKSPDVDVTSRVDLSPQGLQIDFQ